MKTINILKSLSDETRLKLLLLLCENEFSVNEIVSIMDMGQSRISRHLRILTEANLLESRRDGLWVFYRAVESGPGNDFVSFLKNFIADDEKLKEEIQALNMKIAEKSSERVRFFDSIASDWDVIKKDILGGLNVSEEILKRASSAEIIADLGCGTGELLELFAGMGKCLIGVDNSPGMLEKAEERLNSGADLRIGDLEHLPMREGEVDCCIVNMVLHHLKAPEVVFPEIKRVLSKGGRLIIVDLGKHKNEDMRDKYGHRWLGFSEDELETMLINAGMKIESVSEYSGAAGVKVLLCEAHKS